MVAILAPAAAQTNHWHRTVVTQLERAVTALRPEALSPTPVTHAGSLNGGESESFAVSLDAARSYVAVGACDEDCTGLRLVLSNAGGSDLVASQTNESVPVLTFSPRVETGYRIRVIMATCRLNPCWYGVALVEKR
jgi:hypothetical protein